VVTTSFPQNRLDTRQADVINNNIECPARYETFYKSDDTSLLVKVNFIYYPGSKQTQFITIHSISPMANANIKGDYQKTHRPLIDEYLISANGCLILINFLDTNPSADSTSETYNDEFIQSTLSFYSQFEDALLAVMK
jgi:hypothetical protein